MWHFRVVRGRVCCFSHLAIPQYRVHGHVKYARFPALDGHLHQAASLSLGDQRRPSRVLFFFWFRVDSIKRDRI